MSNYYTIPEITPQAVAAKRAAGLPLVLLDVRELRELRYANLGPEVELAPLSRLAQDQLATLPEAAQDKNAEIIVFCHHGVRSAQVVAWMQRQGWTNVWNMSGGIAAYAHDVDPSIGTY
jgi:rhodanese-related sulfurtransferase